MTPLPTTLMLLEKLVAFPTVSAESNLEMIAFLRTYFLERGFAVHQIDDPSQPKAGLFAALGPGSGGVLLSAHTDVVPVVGQDWTMDPFTLTRRGDRLYGRGTTDMKGYLASALALADRAAGRTLGKPLKFAFSYDEEVGCLGIKAMIGKLEATIGLPALCIVGEPTSMQVATSHKGKAAFRVTFRGESGHSAMAPKFVNALDVSADFIIGLRHLQEEIARSGPFDADFDIACSTIHVGRACGGTALNIVPSHASLDFEYRHLPEHSPDAIEAMIAGLVGALNAKYRSAPECVRVNVEKINAYPALRTDRNSDVVSRVAAFAGGTASTSVGFGTEAGYFAALGVPTVVCGPGSMDCQGHKPDESIGLAEIAACDEMHARLLDDLAG